MEKALAQAKAAGRNQEVPVGAVLVRDGRIWARGRNAMIGRNDPTAHAEMVVLRRAGRKGGNYRLGGCDLYVTLEPCLMCYSAMVQARIRRLVYAADDPRPGSFRPASTTWSRTYTITASR